MFKRNKFKLLLAFTFISLTINSQDFEKKYKELTAQNDTTAQLKLLVDWEKTNPKNPELYIAYFNFYAKKSMREVISLDEKPKNDESLQLNDTSNKNPVAYLNASINYRSDILQKGFDYIDKGISLHPSRLDMRFGKIY